MKQKHTLFFALTIFALASCNKEIPDTGQLQSEPLGSGISISATIGNETRTSVVYGNSVTTDGETSEWVAGDIIHLYFYDSDDNLAGNLYFEADSDGSVSTFSPVTPPSQILVPQAPANNNTYRVVATYREGAQLSFLAQEQTGNFTSHIGPYDPMKAELPSVTIDAGGNADLNLSFNHLASMLRFSISNNSGGYLYIASIAVSYSNSANQFYLHAHYDTDHVFIPYGPQPSVHFICTSTILGGWSADYYLMLAGNSVSVPTGDFIVKVASSDGVYELRIPLSSGLESPFEGGKRYRFNLDVTAGPNILSQTIGDLIYELNTTSKKATVTGRAPGNNDISIPATVPYGGDSYDVVAIGDEAFKNLTALRSLTFASDSKLTTIGKSAFQDCPSMNTSINIPASVTSIGDDAFNGTAIPGITFASNSNLITIGKAAFRTSTLSGNIVIPAEVILIDEEAFYTARIESLAFASGSKLTTIGNNAFFACSYMAGNIVLPTSVTTIGNRAFASCTQMTAITIPAGVTSIEGGAFAYTEAMTTINMNCPVPPTLGVGVFESTAPSLTISVPGTTSAINAYNSVINGKLNGWSYQGSGTFDLGVAPVSLFRLGSFSGSVMVSATL
jgi:hypothetical protein